MSRQPTRPVAGGVRRSRAATAGVPGAGRSRIAPGLSNCRLAGCGPARSAFATADASADYWGVGYGQTVVVTGQSSIAAARNWDGLMAKWVLIFFLNLVALGLVQRRRLRWKAFGLLFRRPSNVAAAQEQRV